ncbi:MAG: enoyl-CoA hydratase/isomerase family protein [Bacteroidia bacterium]|nr:enoyl-CoA hydratase/isomerase family protein [Bacteroidia bacterium]
MYNQIVTQEEGNILIVSINRESKMNALNIELLQEIKNALKLALVNDNIRGIIITGSGLKAFAAGADIAEFADFTVKQATSMAAEGHEVMNMIEQSSKPVIAAVNGFALGGGCELAMACHLRVASENAKFGQPEVNLGVPPGYGGTQRLVQLIGKGKALEILMTADAINASQALALGLVNYVVPIEELIPKCKEILTKISSKSPSAISKVIKCVNDYFDSSKNGFESEINEFGNAFGTNDFKEGTKAFLEKRKPLFK